VTAIGDPPDVTFCANHPSRETSLRCGKCGKPICTRCVVQTPVGGRCRECAQLRRLPQYELGTWLVARSLVGGVVTSTLGWYVVSFIPFLRFILSFLVGTAVGTVMSRLAQRRSNLVLETCAVVAVVGGLALVDAVEASALGLPLSAYLRADPAVGILVILPAIIASFMAVTRLR